MRSHPRIQKRVYARTGKTSWEVDAGRLNGKRHRRAFSTEEEARGYAQRLKIQLASRGQEALALNSFHAQQAKAAFELLKPYDAPSLVEVARFFIERNCPVNGGLLLSQVAEKMISLKERQGKRWHYLDDLRKRLNKCIREIGDKKVIDVSREEIESWLYGNPKLGPQSIHNNFRNLRVLFNHAKKISALTVSPMEGIEPPILDREVVVLNVDQALGLLETALRTNDTLQLLPYVTLGLFCGIRSAELQALTWDEIDPTVPHVIIPSAIAKKRRVRTVEIPVNALAWLSAHRGKREGKISPRGIDRRFRELTHQAGLSPWPHNAMRHSFGSYFYALSEDSGKTCARLGHRNDAVLFDHYRALVTKAEAALYFALYPSVNAVDTRGPEQTVEAIAA